MSAVEQKMKAYPMKAKAEDVALKTLQKGFNILDKNQETKLKQGSACGGIDTNFQQSTELSTTLVSLMKYVG